MLIGKPEETHLIGSTNAPVTQAPLPWIGRDRS